MSEKVTIEVPVKMTPDEMSDYARKIANRYRDARSEEIKLDTYKKEKQNAIKAIYMEIDSLVRTYNDGTLIKSIECYTRNTDDDDFGTCISYYRCDNDEFVHRIPLYAKKYAEILEKK